MQPNNSPSSETPDSLSNARWQKLLKANFGFDCFRGQQQSILEHVAAGQHAMVVMPTGGGKSLCFQLPALKHAKDSPELVLVLSPLIALMQDQVDALVRRGIDATFINSSLDRTTRETRQQELAACRYRILYVTPERFRKPEFLEMLSKRRVGLLAIDEAHCVSQWGHDFRPDYSRVASIRESLGNPTAIALTATATTACRQDIYRQLGIAPEEIRLFHEGIDRPNLAIRVETVMGDDEKLERLLAELRKTYVDGNSADGLEQKPSRIVYFSLIKTLEHFGDALIAAGIEHARYHGGLSRSERRRMQDDFMSGRIATVLATPAFGMGVDKEDIRQIIHVETPGSIESYYQEIGRAGRDGQPSECLWLYDQADLMTQMQFIEWANPDAAFYDRVMHALTEHAERCRAYGMQWLNGELQRVNPHDHRLETAIAMLDRHEVIAGPREPECFEVIGDLPEQFKDDAHLGEKRRRDQERLYGLVQLAATPEEDRQAFLNQYFG